MKTKIISILTLSALFIALSVTSMNAQSNYAYCSQAQKKCNAASYNSNYVGADATWYLTMSEGLNVVAYAEGSRTTPGNSFSSAFCQYYGGYVYASNPNGDIPYVVQYGSASLTGTQSVYLEVVAKNSMSQVQISWE